MCSRQETEEVIGQAIASFAWKQILAGITMFVTGLGAWFSLYYQVQANALQIQQEVENGFTQNEAQLINKSVEFNTDALERLETAFTKLDDRLREKGI